MEKWLQSINRVLTSGAERLGFMDPLIFGAGGVLRRSSMFPHLTEDQETRDKLDEKVGLPAMKSEEEPASDMLLETVDPDEIIEPSQSEGPLNISFGKESNVRVFGSNQHSSSETANRSAILENGRSSIQAVQDSVQQRQTTSPNNSKILNSTHFDDYVSEQQRHFERVSSLSFEQKPQLQTRKTEVSRPRQRFRRPSEQPDTVLEIEEPKEAFVTSKQYENEIDPVSGKWLGPFLCDPFECERWKIKSFPGYQPKRYLNYRLLLDVEDAFKKSLKERSIDNDFWFEKPEEWKRLHELRTVKPGDIEYNRIDCLGLVTSKHRQNAIKQHEISQLSKMKFVRPKSLPKKEVSRSNSYIFKKKDEIKMKEVTTQPSVFFVAATDAVKDTKLEKEVKKTAVGKSDDAPKPAKVFSMRPNVASEEPEKKISFFASTTKEVTANKNFFGQPNPKQEVSVSIPKGEDTVFKNDQKTADLLKNEKTEVKEEQKVKESLFLSAKPAETVKIPAENGVLKDTSKPEQTATLIAKSPIKSDQNGTKINEQKKTVTDAEQSKKEPLLATVDNKPIVNAEPPVQKPEPTPFLPKTQQPAEQPAVVKAEQHAKVNPFLNPPKPVGLSDLFPTSAPSSIFPSAAPLPTQPNNPFQRQDHQPASAFNRSHFETSNRPTNTPFNTQNSQNNAFQIEGSGSNHTSAFTYRQNDQRIGSSFTQSSQSFTANNNGSSFWPSNKGQQDPTSNRSFLPNTAQGNLRSPPRNTFTTPSDPFSKLFSTLPNSQGNTAFGTATPSFMSFQQPANTNPPSLQNNSFLAMANAQKPTFFQPPGSDFMNTSTFAKSQQPPVPGQMNLFDGDDPNATRRAQPKRFGRNN